MDGTDDHGTDARLAVAASQGDDEAFGELYARYAPRIGAYLSRMLDDEHLAQDLTHEVFVSALRRLRTHRPPIAFGPWLYRIARNASIDVHRRSQIVRQVPLDGAAPEPPAIARDHGPEAAAEVRQWLEQLRDVMGGLSETHRTVLVLRELEGLSNTEIGERLGVSRPAVEGLLFRARTKLRREYDELVSGRRCESVRAALDRGRDGTRLHGRDLDLAARHVRACAQCRRHAWEAGLATLLHEADRGPARRGALTGLPLGLGVLVHRVALRVHAATRAVAEAPAALSAPWGRAVAGMTAAALVGGVALPQAQTTVRAGHAHVVRASAPVALPARSAGAAPTTLVATVTQVLPARVPPPAAPHASAPAAVAAPAASPSAGPTGLPAPQQRAATTTRRPHRPVRTPRPGPAPTPTGSHAVDATLATVQHAAGEVVAPTRRAVAPVDKVVAPVAQQVQQAAGDVGGALTDAVETAAAVVDQATSTTVTVSTPAVPASPAPAPQPPAPAPPGVPDVPAVPVPDPQPPAVPAAPPAPESPGLPSTPAVPAPAETTPVAPPRVGTLAARRRSAGIR